MRFRETGSHQVPTTAWRPCHDDLGAITAVLEATHYGRLAARTAAELGLLAASSRRRILVTIDNVSPPGAWDKELKAAPWGYGQSQSQQVQYALAEIRQKGLWTAAETLEREIKTLQSEIAYLRR